MQFKVRVRATGAERTVTPAAYAAKGPKVYEKIGVVNDDGSETSPNRTTPQESRSVKGAAPVVVRQIEVPQEQSDEVVKERKKPGPKPRKESISSNSDDNGQ